MQVCSSLPSRGAWIEMVQNRVDQSLLVSLPSRGAWIEILPITNTARVLKSLPSRGAWIEITSKTWQQHTQLSLPSRGAWIEIGTQQKEIAQVTCRSPHGERGLKCGARASYHGGGPSRSPHGERGLKFNFAYVSKSNSSSLPSRGAWIEI